MIFFLHYESFFFTTSIAFYLINCSCIIEDGTNLIRQKNLYNFADVGWEVENIQVFE